MEPKAKKALPFDNSKGVGHLARILQNVGIANLPAVLLRRVTATRTFQGLPAICSSSKDETRYTDDTERIDLVLRGASVSQAWTCIRNWYMMA